MNLTDYPFIIKNPMDLGTVETKLLEERYRFVEEALDDIQLIWDNCKTYNHPDTWIFKEAEALERHFKKMVKNYLPSIPIVIPGRAPTHPEARRVSSANLFEEDPEEAVPYHGQLKFAEKLKHLSSEDVGAVIQFISERCPEAFREGVDQPDHAELHLDQMDQKTFSEASE